MAPQSQHYFTSKLNNCKIIHKRTLWLITCRCCLNPVAAANCQNPDAIFLTKSRPPWSDQAGLFPRHMVHQSQPPTHTVRAERERVIMRKVRPSLSGGTANLNRPAQNQWNKSQSAWLCSTLLLPLYCVTPRLLPLRNTEPIKEVPIGYPRTHPTGQHAQRSLMDVHDWVVLPLVAIHLLQRVKPEICSAFDIFKISELLHNCWLFPAQTWSCSEPSPNNVCKILKYFQNKIIALNAIN